MREFTEEWGERVYESDIKPEIRTLLDLYYNVEKYDPNVNVGFFDIEIQQDDLSENLFADGNVQKAKYPINGITLYSSTTERYTVYLLKPFKDSKFFNTYDDCDIQMFTNEEDLLKSFIVDFQLNDFNIYTGWNSESFDVPYIFNRINNLIGKKWLNKLSKIGIVELNNEREIYRIAGTDHIDMLLLYKKIEYGDRESYSLDFICKFELGEGKLEYDGAINELWRSDFQNFGDYNIHDTRLLVKLNKKLDHLKIARMLAYLGNVPYDKSILSSVMIGSAIMAKIKSTTGKISPNGKRGKKQSFEGAAVLEPIPGMYEYLVCLDYEGLYPACIRSLNISPETFVGRGVDIVDTKKKYPNANIAANSCAFTKERRGAIPMLLDDWYERRNEFKRLKKQSKTDEDVDKYDLLQYVQKIANNSVFGVTGLQSFRYFSINVAEAITLTGQKCTKKSISKTNEIMTTLGCKKSKVIASDTDSEYLPFDELLTKIGKDLNDEDACVCAIRNDLLPPITTSIGKSISEMVKDELNVDKHYFNFEYESTSRRMFITSKKHYGMLIIDEEGKKTRKKKYKGFEVVKSSFGKYYKINMIRGLDAILDAEPEDNIHKIINDTIKGIKDQNLIDISFPQKVNNVTWDTTYRASKSAYKHNEAIRHLGFKNDRAIYNGSKVKWCYLKKDNPFGYDSIAYTDESSSELLEIVERYVDYDVMVEKNIYKKYDAILRACGIRMPERINDGFHDFFSF